MSTPILLECPTCHRQGTTIKAPRPGIKIRCPSCQKVFVYQPADTAVPLPENAENGPKVPCATRTDLGGLSVFSQTELVEQVSEETVAKALAASDHEAGSSRRLWLSLLLVSNVVVVGLLIMLTRSKVGEIAPRGGTARPAATAVVKPHTQLEADPWKATIEKAIQTGNEPGPRGLGADSWQTGQELEPDNGAQVQLPETSRWGVVKVYQPNFGPKQEFYVRLQKKVPLSVLRLITRDVLLRSSPKYKITYVSFISAWQLGELGSGTRARTDPEKARFWALSMLDFRPEPRLSIHINGLTIEEETVLRRMPFAPDMKIIGCWLDDERRERLTIYRDSTDGVYLETVSPRPGTQPMVRELMELPASLGRRFEERGTDSDKSINYFMIGEQGDFETHFKDGMIWKAQSIQ